METEINQDATEVQFKEDGIKILIPRAVLTDMYLYAKEADGEISGLGRVEKKDATYRIVEVKIFEQECSSSETEIDNDELSKFFEELINNGGDPTAWRLWWHSHANMGTFFSGTDVECEKALMDCFKDYLISIVVNKRGNFYSRMELGGTHNYRLINPKCFIEDAVQEGKEDEIKKLVAEKVKKPTYQYQSNYHSHNTAMVRHGQLIDVNGRPLRRPHSWMGGDWDPSYGGVPHWLANEDDITDPNISAEKAKEILRKDRENHHLRAHADKIKINHPEEEPYKSGIFDPFNRVWKNPCTLKVWDRERKAWMVNKKLREMQCDVCNTVSKKVNYSQLLEGWVCRRCEVQWDDGEDIDNASTPPHQLGRSLQNPYENEHQYVD